MKILLRTILIGFAGSLISCSDYLDIEPRNKIPAENVLTDPDGIRAFMANIYYELPVEDLVYFPRAGFNARGNTGSLSLSQYGLEAIHSEWPNWNAFSGMWNKGFKLNRDLNTLSDAIEMVDMAENEREEIYGEIAFLKAYNYYALVKRYGGVPIILENQEYTTDFESLRVPRNTEQETWDFVLEQLDIAAEKLPETRSNPDEQKRRATKWAALGLKSEVALYAGTLAKYWDRVPLSGDAVTQNLVGLPASAAQHYLEQCIEASMELISSGGFSLYGANPANPEEAAINYQNLFMNPNEASSEVIFLKGYGFAGGPLAHDYDGWNNPNQTGEGFPHPGRTNPILELIDKYERYDNPGEPAPIVTTTDGQIHEGGFSASLDYNRYDSPEKIFEGKDARFFATIIYPNATWKGTQIRIQGGIVRPDGSVLESQGSVEAFGETFYPYGAQTRNQYSGFDGTPNMTRSGFLHRKFLDENAQIDTWLRSTTDFIDIRYAEILLNLAEAVVESNSNQYAAEALQGLNDVRRRAGHTVDIPLTLDNVLRERAVELSFENKDYWDMIRRRTFHDIFNNYVKKALVPMLDLRGAEPSYIFVRRPIPGANPNTFFERDYYRSIPGVSNNGLVQNPQH